MHRLDVHARADVQRHRKLSPGERRDTCDPYQCGNDGACRTSCTGSRRLHAPEHLQLGVSCGKKPIGATCAAAAECNSGLCEQGVCCAAACTGICRSCALAGTLGTCTSVPAGADPLNQCADQGAASCGTGRNLQRQRRLPALRERHDLRRLELQRLNPHARPHLQRDGRLSAR